MIEQGLYGGQTGDGMADYSGSLPPEPDWFTENAPPADDGVLANKGPISTADISGRGIIGPGQTAADPQSDFMRIFGQYAPSAKNLEDHWGEFTALHPGWTLKKNASGYADAIIGPNGQIIDTQRNSGYERSDAWQWNDVSGGGNNGGPGQFGGSYTAPQFQGVYSNPAFTETLNYQPWDKKFTAPTIEQARATPGYGFVQQQGEDAILRAAAKTGTSRGGGILKDLDQFNTGLADTTYGAVYGRAAQEYNTELNNWAQNLGLAQSIYGSKLQNYNTNSGNNLQNFLTNYGIFGDNANRGLQEFQTNYGIYGDNFNRDQGAQGQAFNQLYSLAGLGMQGTNGQANLYNNYGANLSNLYTGGAAAQSGLTTQIGNVNAAGQVGSANAYGTAFGNIGTDLATIYANQGKGLYGKPSQPVWA